MIIINTISDEIFTLNGTPYATIFIPVKLGTENIGIYNSYDTNQVLLGSTDYSEFNINGTTYTGQTDTMSALLPVIYAGQVGVEVLTNTQWGEIDGTITNQLDLIALFNTKANTSSISTVGFSNDYEDLDNLPVLSGLTASPFINIDEGNGVGIIISGRTAENYGDIGLGAFDVSQSNFASTTYGATGNYSSAFGRANTASGNYSTAFGQESTASGVASVSLGYNTNASGDYSNAFGSETIASGLFSTAFGTSSLSSGLASTAFGNSEASGDYSNAFGYTSRATGDYSNAFGYTSRATGDFSQAFGFNSEASGNYSTAFGYNSEASGLYSISFGRNTTASGNTSTVFGRDNTVNGDYSITFGRDNTVNGDYSTAFGFESEANGDYSTAIGLNAISNSLNSVAVGLNVNADTFGEASFGINNTIITGDTTTWNASDRLFNVGNGTNTSNRSDALTILKKGDVIAPSLTTDIISSADSKVLITKEYGDLNYTGDTSTGLEALDEGNGIGYRLIGTDPDDFGNIGLDSIDLTLASPAGFSDTGVSAPASIGLGLNNKITGGGYSTVIGSANEISSSSFVNTIIGAFNNIESGYGNTTIGVYNTASTNVNGYSSLFGMGNYAEGITPAGAIGIALNVNAMNQFAVGASNVIWTGSTSASDRPLFQVGNGTYSTPAGQFSAITRSDAFLVKHNGIVESYASNSLINSGEDSTLITKGWYESQITGGTTYEGYSESGTRVSGIKVTLGDYDDSNNGTKLIIDDEIGGIIRTNDGSGIQASYFNIHNGSYTMTLYSNNVTDNRTIEMPDKNGTVALTNDLNYKSLTITAGVGTGNTYTVASDDYQIIGEVGSGMTFNLPTEAESTNRVLKFTAKSIAFDKDVKESNTTGGITTASSGTTFANNITLHCDGTSWYRTQ
ncbi:hypothetical protein [Psychroserpens mesophilus]|uniref:hypothetical protein n=1 Tax=Psychroserpens mesophilus TaxID=325473 RepID=UPI003D64B5E1